MRGLFAPLAIALAALASISGTNAMAQTNTMTAGSIPAPPAAKRVAKKTEVHGETLVDEYFWLREKTSPEVISYLEAENAYADAVMKPTAALQEKLYKEMLGRIKQTDQNVPYRENGYYYYTRTVEGQQYPIYARKKGSLDAPEEIVLDLNELNKGHKYTSLGAYSVSDDGNLLAYSIDHNGYREYLLRIKDLRTGKDLPEDLGKVVYAFWANDNRTLFYGTEDAAKRPHRLYRHTVGEPKEKDVLVAEEKDELFRLYAGRSRSRGYVFLGSESSDTSEWSFVPADKPAEAPKVIVPRKKGVEYAVDHHGDKFYIRINDAGRNFRLVTAPVSDPRPANWKEVIAHRDDALLEDTDMFANFYVVTERDKGLQKLRITDFKTGKSHFLEFPEPVYSASVNVNKEFDTKLVRYAYQSFITPSSIYDYDVTARKSTLLKQQPVLGGYDPKQYASERVFATAPDGTKVPVSLVYKKGFKRDGSHPAHLYAYGSYGYPSNVSFSTARLSLLDRGFVYALAHIRGGSDLGRAWYDEGKLMKKKNTFTDFIAAAEHLVNEKYTSKDRLVISGGSAGGLLMGAVTNMRPDLFRVVVSYVPFVDVVNTMLDPTLPLTIQEYLEWGNPNEKEAYQYIKSYSPYDNIAAKDYPAMLVRASLNDSQVPYWEATKYVAKLRAMKTDKNVLLLKTNMGAGHGGASGRYDALRDTAFDYAFILTQLGINE
ncbi:MAG TPA: S9 family peptidase [Pyrinomonadaceae bacterium]|nr:S9 family peptidase [Pyrinomonadaceae bacterium]